MKTLEERRQYWTQWRRKNRQKHLEKQRAYIAENREHIAMLGKIWREKNAEKVKLDRKEDYAKNRERYLANVKQYKLNNIEHVAWIGLKRRSEELGMPFILTEQEFIEWYQSQEQQCVYCDLTDLSLDSKLTSGKQPRRFTIDRKEASHPYMISNIVFSCWRCNRIKGNHFNYEEFRDIAQRHIKSKWMKLVGVNLAVAA